MIYAAILLGWSIRVGFESYVEEVSWLIVGPSWGNKSAVFCSRGFWEVENPLIRNSSLANPLPAKSSEIFLVMVIYGRNAA